MGLIGPRVVGASARFVLCSESVRPSSIPRKPAPDTLVPAPVRGRFGRRILPSPRWVCAAEPPGR